MFFRRKYLLIQSHTGINRIYGTVAFAGSPDIPTPGSLVVLSVGRFYVPRSSTTSDEAGAYTFEGLRGWTHPEEKFSVMAYDPTGQYDPVAKAGLIPSPMPPDPLEHP